MYHVQMVLDGDDEKMLRELRQRMPGLTQKEIFLAGLEKLLELKNKKEKSL